MNIFLILLILFLKITEEGVRFISPVDGTQMLLTPEQSIQFQVRHFLYNILYYIADIVITE